ncbi:MAG: hypothetical protein PHU61_01120 [Candidatus Absconditabacteria bacterium]|nr:hypothetical protein [Candidatus Absconditabacteria bacterium]MDD3868100.1 hypothetical protein [Candidatus Absconditabacteria bacterium]MDD4714348.1 hypothetical protein [Candidatus Absconditabacteria bacterium]
MSKQEYILAVIDAMPDREMGRGIKAMVQNNQLEDRTINVLVLIFKKAVDRLTDVIKKHKIMENIEALERLSAQKEVQRQQDAKDIESLNGMLDAL